MTFLTPKKHVATEPMPNMAVKTGLHGTGAVKVARIENKVELVKLRVLVMCEELSLFPGDVIYIRGDNHTAPWAKTIHENILPVPFILVPEGAIDLVGTESDVIDTRLE